MSESPIDYSKLEFTLEPNLPGPPVLSVFWAKGIVDRTRQLVFRYGRMRLGLPEPSVVRALQQNADIGYLEKYLDRLFAGDVKDWDDLLATWQPRPGEDE